MSRRPFPPTRRTRHSQAQVATPLVNGLAYLEAWRSVWLAMQEECAEPRELGVEPGCTPRGKLDHLLDSIQAYEDRHADDPLVGFFRRADVDAVDGALLATVLTDRICSSDQLLGIPVLRLVEHATQGRGGVAEGIAHVDRLRPEAPIVARGLVDVTTREGDRWLASVCKATDRLVSWALPDVPLACVKGNAAGDLSGPPWMREPEAGAAEEEATAHTSARLVLPPEAAASFDRALRMVRVRQRCLDELGLDELLPEGKGVALLFHGPPGCGKTLAARILARELQRPLRLVSSSRLQGRYFGETEERIEKVVGSAEAEGAVLVFDEADSIVVDRATASHTAYRSFTNALLRALEETSGVCVFTTNAADGLDPALERRLSMRIEVPPPGAAERLHIWEGLLPKVVPLADDVDLEELARHELTGGEIKNAVLAAVSEAALRDPVLLTRADVEGGIEAATKERWTKRAEAGMGFGENASGCPDAAWRTTSSRRPSR